MDLLGVLENDFDLVSIIVLMWNEPTITIWCLSSIINRTDYPNYEIILVDNGSDPKNSAILLEWVYANGLDSRIKIIKSTFNRGFSAGNNLGIKSAKGKFIIILNNDTEVTIGWIQKSLRHFTYNPTLGVLGFSTDNIGNEARVGVKSEDGTWLSYTSARFSKQKRLAFENERVAFFGTVISKKVIEQVGLLNEDFGLGSFEDDEYCMRTTAQGFSVMIARDIFVHHKLSASFKLLDDSQTDGNFQRNKKLYENLWGPWKPHTYSSDEFQ
jgi:GT2 family glycosyltransferase